MLLLPAPYPAKAVLLADQADEEGTEHVEQHREEADQQELHLTDAHPYPVRQTAHQPQHGGLFVDRLGIALLAQLILLQAQLGVGVLQRGDATGNALQLDVFAGRLFVELDLPLDTGDLLVETGKLPFVARLLAQYRVGGAVDATNTAADGDGRQHAVKQQRPEGTTQIPPRLALAVLVPDVKLAQFEDDGQAAEQPLHQRVVIDGEEQQQGEDNGSQNGQPGETVYRRQSKPPLGVAQCRGVLCGHDEGVCCAGKVGCRL